ncbi:hypothetical protein E4U27_006241 [Claviceps purpurea]|nr:hypothetical protein E4U27_006241 [Claviceps purpurea]
MPRHGFWLLGGNVALLSRSSKFIAKSDRKKVNKARGARVLDLRAAERLIRAWVAVLWMKLEGPGFITGAYSSVSASGAPPPLSASSISICQNHPPSVSASAEFHPWRLSLLPFSVLDEMDKHVHHGDNLAAMLHVIHIAMESYLRNNTPG